MKPINCRPMDAAVHTRLQQYTHRESNLIYRVTVVQYAGVVKPEMPACVYLLCYSATSSLTGDNTRDHSCYTVNNSYSSSSNNNKRTYLAAYLTFGSYFCQSTSPATATYTNMVNTHNHANDVHFALVGLHCTQNHTPGAQYNDKGNAPRCTGSRGPG